MTYTRTYTLEELALNYMLEDRRIKVNPGAPDQQGYPWYWAHIHSIIKGRNGQPNRVHAVLDFSGTPLEEAIPAYGVEVELSHAYVKFVP